MSFSESQIEPELLWAIQNATDGLIPITSTKACAENAAIFTHGNSDYSIVLTSDFNCSVNVSDDLSKFALYMNYGLMKFYQEMTKMLGR